MVVSPACATRGEARAFQSKVSHSLEDIAPR